MRILASMIVLILLGCSEERPAINTEPSSAAAAAPAPGAPDKSPAMQAERQQLIRELMADGYFLSHRKTSADSVWLVVTPKFLNLDFETKNVFVGVVYAYHFDSTSDWNVVHLLHSKTNNEVGAFSALRGGLKLN